jgi:hypothetical protein
MSRWVRVKSSCSRVEVVEAGQRRRRAPLAGIRLRAERQDGGTGLVAQGQRSGPASAGRRDRIADHDLDRGAAGEPAARADEFPAAADAHRDNGSTSGSGGFERAEVEGPQPRRGVKRPFRPDRQAAAAGQRGSEVTSVTNAENASSEAVCEFWHVTGPGHQR